MDTLWLFCRPQANGVTDRQFGQALIGDAIDHATQALLEAIADFFPQRKRLLLRSLAQRNAALMDRMLTTLEQRLNDPAYGQELEQTMLTALEQQLDAVKTGPKSVTNAPASVAFPRTG